MPETMTAAEYRAKKPSKYRNKKTVVDGIRFDSKREASRYLELIWADKGDGLEDLVIQPSFSIDHNGVHICKYKADFAYMKDGEYIVEDVKSKPTMTPVYRLKKKLVKAFHGIEITEIT